MDGKSEVCKYIKLLDAYAIAWWIVSDGDALNENKDDVIAALIKCGKVRDPVPPPGDFQLRKQFARHHGVFVVGAGTKETLTTYLMEQREALGLSPPEDVGDSKPRMARWSAEHVPPPPEIKDLLDELWKGSLGSA